MVFTCYFVEPTSRNLESVKLMKSFNTEQQAYLELGEYILKHHTNYFEDWIETIGDCPDEDKHLYKTVIDVVENDKDFVSKILQDYNLIKTACHYIDNLQLWDSGEDIEFTYGVKET